MDVLGLIVSIVVAILVIIGAKTMWWHGFVAGTVGEAKSWLDALETLRVPSWQSYPIPKEGMTTEQAEWMNRIYVASYAIALDNIMSEIADAKLAAVEKAQAAEERQRRRLSS